MWSSHTFRPLGFLSNVEVNSKYKLHLEDPLNLDTSKPHVNIPRSPPPSAHVQFLWLLYLWSKTSQSAPLPLSCSASGKNIVRSPGSGSEQLTAVYCPSGNSVHYLELRWSSRKTSPTHFFLFHRAPDFKTTKKKTFLICCYNIHFNRFTNS